MPRMARITDAALKPLVPVAESVASDEVVLSRQGADLAGLHPFHDGQGRSLKVALGNNLRHCFGGGASGGPVDWVIMRRGMSFRHAVELLRQPPVRCLASGAWRPLPSRSFSLPAGRQRAKLRTARAAMAPASFVAWRGAASRHCPGEVRPSRANIWSRNDGHRHYDCSHAGRAMATSLQP